MSLIVYLGPDRVGELQQDASGLMRFRYDEAWLNRPDAMALSRALPLQSETFDGRRTRPFFAGVLPEQAPRSRIAALLGISEGNDFGLLERIGGECAGAVRLIPDGPPPTSPGGRDRRVPTDEELIDIVAELPRRPLLAGRTGVRLSLAGAQDKLPIIVDNGRIGVPLGDEPSTHILKPEPEHFPGLVANEALCMRLAKAVSLNVASVAVRRVGRKPCIVVERFDRTMDSAGTTHRLHQEDFCQALGLPPERKYQQEGGPTVRDSIALLREWSTVPVVDIRSFLDGLIFNVVIGNADAHGKNFSILYRGRDRRLAPFYDLVSTVAWPELSKRAAMRIGGCQWINAVAQAHWRKMAAQSGLGWPMVRDRVATLAEEIKTALEDVAHAIEMEDPTSVDRWVELVGARADKLRRAGG